MRFILFAALCLACSAKHPPREGSIRAGMRLAKASIVERLRGCDKLPQGAAREINKKGARQISMGEGDAEVFEMELEYGDRNFFVKVQRPTKGDWTIQGEVVPDPCTDDVLAVTEDEVDAINAQNLPWTAALSPEMIGKTARDFGFASTAETLAQPLPSGPPPGARRALEPSVVGGVTLPESYDATDRYAGDYPCKAFSPRDQGPCGTCTHFATSSVFGARLCMRNGRTSNTNVLMSPRQLSDCAIAGSSGCPVGGSGQTWANLGYYAANPARGREEWCLPYKNTKDACTAPDCPGSRTFPAAGVKSIQGIPSIQAELLQNGPLVISFVVHNSLFAYSGGVYTLPSVILDKDWVGGHAVMLVGWGVDAGIPYWKVQNSWGAGWGEKGTLRIRRGTNECDIETREINSIVPTPSPQCPNSPCANGAITLSDCTCKCVGPIMGGALCDTVVNQCQNGGRFDRWKTSCLCPTGISGPLCQFGFRVPAINTASCAGTASSMNITYGLEGHWNVEHQSTVGMYTLTQEKQWNSLAVTKVCASGTCPLTGRTMLSLGSTIAPGTYRIMFARWYTTTSNGVTTSGYNNFDAGSPVLAYHTVIPAASCTPASLAQARADNALDKPIVAAEAAEAAALPVMKARLDTAVAVQAQLTQQALEQGVAWLTFGGLPFEVGEHWVGTPKQVCFYIPAYLNQAKQNKRFELRKQDGSSFEIFKTQYPAINFAVNPSAMSPNAACFTAGILPTYTSGPYTIAMSTSSSRIDYVQTRPFNVMKIEMKWKSLTNMAGISRIEIVWIMNPGTAMAGDTIRLIGKTGITAATVVLSTETSLVQQGTFTADLPRLAAGQPTRLPYTCYFYRGGSTEATTSAALLNLPTTIGL